MEIEKENQTQSGSGLESSSCCAMSDAPAGEWVEIEGTDGGLRAYKFGNSAGGVMISVCPQDEGRSPLEVGVYVADAEIKALVRFLSRNADVDLPDTAAQDSASKSNSPAVSG